MNKRSRGSQRTPSWLLIASASVLVLTLAFMMVLVLLAVNGQEVPRGSRFLIVIVFALGAAFGSAGLGGYAAAEGKLPFPGAENHPLAISATGGIAVLAIVLLLGDRIVPRVDADQDRTDLRLQKLSGSVVSTDPTRIMIEAGFRRLA